MARGKRTTTDDSDYSNHFEEAARHIAERDDDEVPLLPWLEAVDEDEPPEGTSRVAFWVGGGLVFALIFALGLHVLRPGPGGPDLASTPAPETIPAPDSNPAPDVVTTRTPTLAEAKTPAHAPAPARAPQEAVGSPGGRNGLRPGPTIQLASYYSARRAERHWDLLLRRHKNLAGLDHAVVTGAVGGRTVYRLRASGAGAFQACERLRAARLGCLQIGH